MFTSLKVNLHRASLSIISILQKLPEYYGLEGWESLRE